MKIVKEPDRIYKCEDCGCEFIPEGNDIKEGSGMQEGAFLGILPLISRCRYVLCPFCNKQIIIEWYR